MCQLLFGQKIRLDVDAKKKKAKERILHTVSAYHKHVDNGHVIVYFKNVVYNIRF